MHFFKKYPKKRSKTGQFLIKKRTFFIKKRTFFIKNRGECGAEIFLKEIFFFTYHFFKQQPEWLQIYYN
ncbi:MAG: hypothetical protein HEEMFOPI_01377 [Holosporales bacterium]